MAFGSLTGDFSKLTAFTNKIGKLSSDATMRGLAKEIGDEMLFQVQVGFSKSQDPWEKPWASKKFADGRGPLRGQTGKLMRSFVRVYVGPDAVTIANKQPYASFPQTGTGVFGPTKSRIYPKNRKALRFKTAGKWMFASSVEGSPARPMMPTHGNPLPPTWSRALQARARAYFLKRLGGR